MWNDLRDFLKDYIGPRLYTFAAVQVMHAVAIVLLLAFPLLLRETVNRAITRSNFSLLVWLIAAMVGVYAAWAVVVATKIYLGHEVAQEVTRWMRNDLYQQFQKLSLSFHDEKKTGELLSRLVDDLNVVQEGVHHGPEAMVNATVMITGATAILLWLDWKLALASLSVVPLLIIHARKMSVKMWEGFRHVRKRKASLSDELEENLSGIHVIKAFVGENREAERVEEENENHYQSRMGVIRWVAALFPGAVFLNKLSIVIAILYGGIRVMNGTLEMGTLVAAWFYLQLFLQPIMRFIMTLERGGKFFASLERFQKYMRLEPDVQEADEAAELEEVEGTIRFEDVHFSYDEQPVLKGIDLEAKPGQMVALVGPSGAGKTTILRLIPRFYTPLSGRITLDGVPTDELTLRSLRSKIGMVMQDDFLFSGSVADNIAYGKPSAPLEEIQKVARQANVDEFVEDMPDGYDTEIGKEGIKLSEGQRQRISIARALLKNPPILLLDEATSSVDSETELLIQEAIERLREGRTTFAIAHRLSTVLDADRILFIQDGRITEEGTHRELLDKDGDYARFYRIQFGEMKPA